MSMPSCYFTESFCLKNNLVGKKCAKICVCVSIVCGRLVIGCDIMSPQSRLPYLSMVCWVIRGSLNFSLLSAIFVFLLPMLKWFAVVMPAKT